MKLRDILGLFGATATFGWGLVWFAVLVVSYPELWRSFLWIPALASIVAALSGLFWARAGERRFFECPKTRWTSMTGIFGLGGIFSGGLLGIVLGALGTPGGLNSPSFPNWSMKAGAGLGLTGVVVGALSMMLLTPLGFSWVRACCLGGSRPRTGRVVGGAAIVMIGSCLCAAAIGFLTLGPVLGLHIARR